MSSRLTIQKSGNKYVIRASSPRIKQVFWGWAGGRRGMHLYGQEVGAWRGDNTTWEWRLTRKQIADFLVDIAHGMGAGYYESKAERDDALHVSTVLSKKIA